MITAHEQVLAKEFSEAVYDGRLEVLEDRRPEDDPDDQPAGADLLPDPGRTRILSIILTAEKESQHVVFTTGR